MKTQSKTASVIFAAGRGSRMKGYNGNKTLLPLISGDSPFDGGLPILPHILDNLPDGPKALVVNYKKGDVIAATEKFDLTYCEQPELNGTGGALLSAKSFIEEQDYHRLIITMGDVPLVKNSTYERLLEKLEEQSMVVLGFRPFDKKQYGVLETDGSSVERITEWKYWNGYPREKQDMLTICNSGIYGVRKNEIMRYLRALEQKPHIVAKERNGEMVEVREFFITDMIGLMYKDGLSVGYTIAEDEYEVMGIDDLAALKKAQEIFKQQSC